MIKVQSNKIYGGYNPIGYASRDDQWLTSSDSFIFSFENDQDTCNMEIGRVLDKTFALYEDCDCYFLYFGDLFVFKFNQNLYLNHSQHPRYDRELYVGRACLPIEEIEFFSVVKK